MEIENNKIKLRTRDRDTFFKKEFSKLKIKVALNWFEIIALFLVTFFGVLKISFILELTPIIIPVAISLSVATLITFLFFCFREYQLKITRFDKEHIYKKISEDLIDKSKHED